MSFFRKIKQLLHSGPPAASQERLSSASVSLLACPADDSTQLITADKSGDADGAAHLAPISHTIRHWLDGRDWHYHYTPAEEDDELRTHHFVVGFKHESLYWHCIFRIRENNQLVSMIGVLQDPVPASHLLNVLYRLAEANLSRGFGNFELDVQTGEARVSMHFDGEFTLLSQRMLDTYMHGMANLVELLYDIISQELAGSAYTSLTAMMQSEKAPNLDDGSPYFTPTVVPQ